MQTNLTDTTDTTDTFALGAHVRDRTPAKADSNTELIVVDLPTETAGERTHGERTIAQLNDCAPETPVVEAVYCEALDRDVPGWRAAYLDGDGARFVAFLEAYRREWAVAPTRYTFPVSRLALV